MGVKVFIYLHDHLMLKTFTTSLLFCYFELGTMPQKMANSVRKHKYQKMVSYRYMINLKTDKLNSFSDQFRKCLGMEYCGGVYLGK